MKPTLFLLVVCGLTAVTASAQTFPIDSLPKQGVVPDKGWRWHAGDNPTWASPAIDDARWDTISSYPTIDQLPSFRKTGIGWLRLTVDLDSSVTAQSLSIRIAQIGASEVYLDGKLLRAYGRMDRAGRVIEAATAPQGDYEVLPLLRPGIHVLAVRLAHRPVPWYEPNRLDKVNGAFGLRLAPTKGITRRVVLRTFWDAAGAYWLAGFFLALGVVHALYFMYRRKRISLIFGLTMVFGAVYFIAENAIKYTSSLVQIAWLGFFSLLSFTLYFCCLLLTYYAYLQRRTGIVFWITSLLMLVNVILSNYTGAMFVNYLFSFGITMLLTQGMFLSVRAIKAKSADGWIVMGSLISLIVMLTSQLIVNYVFAEPLAPYAATINETINALFFITVPLTLALLLARENAQTNAALTHNLAEVKQLSEEKEAILTQQKAFLEEQVAARTAELSQSLAELRATQQQLVQREKMASLGELTAGIAHEIQNPLNFVNNFTEVSTELVEEMQEEKRKPAAKRDEALETELLGDLTQNLSKISLHGKRASSIVRGMLEHSRNTSGQHEPTNLNALADEYLRLSYHGLRAKDKLFNARLLTDFDLHMPPVSVVSQDLGRVLLNLFNNAFYAVQQRATLALAGYEPTVSVQTKTAGNIVEIRVTDNGTGIPAGTLGKIFQPFFTTKPAGQGTGLGLSLSYDIITKGHGGNLRAESVEGEGTTFVINLPLVS
ncbi:ATP-binding protein [Fibrella aquatilis]|uniref:histidine kinase n=1 Tax=Fibrella aquatilis TaxID=2817059 RepID=A0A939G2Y9_9BACT|nr:ATP-binding protein [Fibrella aquatilis]MBO0930931.1 histidine kinase [Fibrella aquatilis]